MTEEKYQDIKSSICCICCANYDIKERICFKTRQEVEIIGKPCKDFELAAFTAHYLGIETNEDYTYFSERYRKEQE